MQGISLQRRELLPRRRSEINGPISLRPPRRRTDQASTTPDGLAYEAWPALPQRIASGARAPGYRASKEVLADLFWPDVSIEHSRPSLHSALHQLRRAMSKSVPSLGVTPVVVYADQVYSLNSSLGLRTDVDVFRSCLAQARREDARGELGAAREAYQLALTAYTGELLPEERYEDWVIVERSALEADQAA